MTDFNASRSYRADLDVRDWHVWKRRLKADQPEGVLWTLVGTRRSGKTWALRAQTCRDRPVPHL